MGMPGRDRALSPVNPGDSATRLEVCPKGPPLGAGGEEITWPDEVARWNRKASNTRHLKPENLKIQGQNLEESSMERKRKGCGLGTDVRSHVGR